MINKIFIGDALEILQEFPDSFVDMCITSPPYYGLRDYGVQGQLGQESDFNLYIDKLLAIFDEVKRILKNEGTCWVNISDTYEDKSLLGIPFQFVQGMLNKGWILRNTIIWHKPNAMPINVKDRFTIDFEYLFFFSKNKKYYFEQQVEPVKQSSIKRITQKTFNQQGGGRKDYGRTGINPNRSSRKTLENFAKNFTGKRNKRCVWTIPTKGYKDIHFAVYPPELIETPIKAGCPINGIILDPFIGSGTTGMVAKSLSRNYIGIELNPDYLDLIKSRIDNTIKPLV